MHARYCKYDKEPMAWELPCTMGEPNSTIHWVDTVSICPLNSYFYIQSLVQLSGLIMQVSFCNGWWWTKILTIDQSAENNCGVLSHKWDINITPSSSHSWKVQEPWEKIVRVIEVKEDRSEPMSLDMTELLESLTHNSCGYMRSTYIWSSQPTFYQEW